MEETHEFKFRGVWLPAEIMNMLSAGEISPLDTVLLAMIDALVAPGKGCYASNEYLANRIGRGITQTKEAIARLKDLGLIKQVKFDGKRRYLETAWSRVELPVVVSDSRKSGQQTAGNPAPSIYNRKVKTKSVPKGPDGDGEKQGFGLVETKPDDTTKEDTIRATQLLEAVKKKMGTSHPYVTKARLSSWAIKLSRLRTLDKIPDKAIQKTMDWYTRHLGEEFVPEAYSGETFRKKFPAIQAAMERDKVGSVEVTPQAEAIFSRIGGLAWPKGSARMVPGVIQACLEGYTTWLKRFKAFTAILADADAIPDLGKDRVKFLRLAQSIIPKLVEPSHYVQGWITDVHHRVANWEEWSGDFKPYIWKPDCKRFTNMGRGWAEAYYNNPEYWDRLMELMHRVESEMEL